MTPRIPAPDEPAGSGSAGSELVLRIALRSADAQRLNAEIEAWLAGHAGDSGAPLPSAVGPTTATNDRGELEIHRLSDRLLARTIRRDPPPFDRTWTTELDFHDAVELDVRVRVDEDAGMPFAARRTPTLVARIVGDPRHAVADIAPLAAVPSVVAAGDVAALVALVDAKRRTLPVVVVSLPSPADPVDLALRLAGAARVLCLEPDASLALTGIVGKWHSVFHGGVRTYPPGFTWRSPARQAPLALAARLNEVRDGLPWSERFVRAILAMTAASYRDRPFVTVHDLERRVRLARGATGTLDDDLAVLGDEIAALSAERDALRAELVERNMLIGELAAENELLRAQLRDRKPARRTDAER